MFGNENDPIYKEFTAFLNAPYSSFAKEFFTKLDNLNLHETDRQIRDYASANNLNEDEVYNLMGNFRLAAFAPFHTCDRRVIVDRFLKARKNCKNNNPSLTQEEINKILPSAEDFLVGPPTEDLFIIPAPDVPYDDEWPMNQSRIDYLSPESSEEETIDDESQLVKHDSIQITKNHYSGDISLKPRDGYKFKSITPTLQRPTVDENGNWNGQFRSGLIIEEIDIHEEGTIFTTTVYLYYAYEPSNRGWKLDVIDQSGATSTYSFGQSTHQNVVDQR